MKKTLFVVLIASVLLLYTQAYAHPGSGIVVDRQGNVYFVDTGSGVWKINRDGTLTRHTGPAYHWMAIDLDGRLEKVSLPHFKRDDATVTRVGGRPALLLSSDFPIVIGRDGSLYYPWFGTGDRLQVFRLAPSGKTSVLATLPVGSDGKTHRWLNGIAVGPGGSIYYTENRAVRKITPQGKFATLADSITLSECASIPGIDMDQAPFLRGLDVDGEGTVYVAASGCGSVLKITADGKVTTILTSSSPWSPTGIALSGNDVYVLEYFHTVGDNRREWLPRVRKISPDGRVTTLASVDRR